MKTLEEIAFVVAVIVLSAVQALLAENALPQAEINKPEPSKIQETAGAVHEPLSETEGTLSERANPSLPGGATPDPAVPAAPNSKASSPLPVIHVRSEEALRKAGLKTEAAELKELDEFVIAKGVVRYDETRLAQLGSRVPGIAWRVYKKEGDSVRAGDVLAILDSDDVGQAKADLLEASIAFNLKAETLRELRLVRSSIPPRSLRKADAEEKLAEVHLFNAKQTLINLGLLLPKDWDLDHSVEARAKKIQFLGIPESTIAGFGPEVVTANLIPMCASFDGVVIDRQIVKGEVVQIALAQFVIADVSHMWLKLNVSAADALSLEAGQRVWFSSDGIPGEIEGRVSWVATDVDEESRTLQVRCEAENPVLKPQSSQQDGQRLLRAGVSGTARIRVRNDQSALMVPNKAIQLHGKEFVVFVPLSDGHTFQPRVVVLGMAHAASTEIIQGIRAGERIVTSGSYLLKAEMDREPSAAQHP